MDVTEPSADGGVRPATDGARVDSNVPQPDAGDSDSGMDPPTFPAGPESSWHQYQGAPEDRALVEGIIEEHMGAPDATRTLYVAPPSGSEVGSGTLADPYHDLLAVVDDAQAGDRVLLAPGQYRMREIADAFGHTASKFQPHNSGALGSPIVVATDPDLFDPSTGAVAVIDFEFDNVDPRTSRSAGVTLYREHWIFENLEMKNALNRIFWLGGAFNILRNLHLHNVHHVRDGSYEELDGPNSNNEGHILVATNRDSYNVIMNNHIHHLGFLDPATGLTIADERFNVNFGCIYTETRQAYDSSVLADLAFDDPWSSVADSVQPPNGHVYIYNNEAHDCSSNGIATKTSTEGPFFFLSNVIHGVYDYGIKNTKTDGVIRNNIIYSTGMRMLAGIVNGYTSGRSRHMWSAPGTVIENNTIIGTEQGIVFQNGWGVVARRNLIVSNESIYGIAPTRHFQLPDTFTSRTFIGEFLYGLDEANPFFDYITRYERDYLGLHGHGSQLAFENNLYNKEPALDSDLLDGAENSQFPIRGRVLPEEYEIRSMDDIASHLRDPGMFDFRRDESPSNPLALYGSNKR